MVDCERCERGFPHQSAYLQHIRDSRSHNICEDCDKDYLHESDLIQHYRTENGHAYCHLCDRVLKGQRGLDDHNKSCHYCCRKCGRCFRTENELRHVSISSAIIPRSLVDFPSLIAPEVQNPPKSEHPLSLRPFFHLFRCVDSSF
ncbi:hypothetical protein M404DRAFT_963504 [Pisolithus tinctorius Marx 270]|uniref:C2H2-type domain-containing protein n=1 Tax=Pisolithus tinctorius Marx 270 TaxID=870435 RepID=A0A0C3J4Q1_PISTI|nr:hypothetical protein M404DRAFT_963504 [Pisolithus tinctorius Marx 270]